MGFQRGAAFATPPTFRLESLMGLYLLAPLAGVPLG
jgi:hypothetical protein